LEGWGHRSSTSVLGHPPPPCLCSCHDYIKVHYGNTPPAFPQTQHVADSSWVSRGGCRAPITPRPPPVFLSGLLRAAASVSPLSSFGTHIHRSTLTCRGRVHRFHGFTCALEFENRCLVHRGDCGGRTGRKHPSSHSGHLPHTPPNVCAAGPAWITPSSFKGCAPLALSHITSSPLEDWWASAQVGAWPFSCIELRIPPWPRAQARAAGGTLDAPSLTAHTHIHSLASLQKRPWVQ